VNDAVIDNILRKHRISPYFFPAFYRLIEEGAIASKEFHVRVRSCANYKDACDEIMEHLARPYAYLFESNPIPFESLETE
jgi:hypothetical protein